VRRIRERGFVLIAMSVSMFLLLAVMPVLLGSGIPVLPPGASTNLVLGDTQQLASGIMVLAYSVKGTKSAAPKIRFVKKKSTSATKKKSGKRVVSKRKGGKRR